VSPGPRASRGSVTSVGLRLSELAEQYIADQRPRPDTVSEVRAIVARLTAFLGEDKLATAITKGDLTAFKLLAAKLPSRMTAQQRAMSIHALAAQEHPDTLSPRTVRKWFDLLGACFAWGVKHDLVPANPVTGIKPDFRKAETNDRDSYTPDELHTLFTSRIYTGPAKATEFWLPLLGLFTGARLNELGQLALSDVRVDGPVPFITIDDRSDHPEVVKRLKNTQSRRVIPIHPTLMQLGFGTFVRAAQGTHVFPELPRQTKDGPECTAAFSKWFGRYLKEIGIKRPRLAAAHSLRHTFVEACDN
jgi:integrase